MIRPINRIVIVGGGTSGWMTAAFLYSKLKRTEIVLIDKKQGEPVGVGEATILSFKQFMADCGFPVEDWLGKIDATFKCGILFEDWQKEGQNLWHPFAFPEFNAMETNLLNLWTKNKDLEYFTHACALYNPGVTDNKVDPKNISTYSYHINCGKLVSYIKGKLLSKIAFVEDDVVEVDRNSRGGLNSITLGSGQVIESDLYIDCTGWKRLLGPEPDTVDCSGRLFCDTAIAGPAQYADKDSETRPYTTCSAVEHGWIWKTPNQSRIGSGLVFNRSITDIDEAKDFFADYWDGRVDRDSLRVLNWTPYYHKNAWVDNVCCNGLSSGFIEPLESTGIALICSGVIEIVEAVQGHFYNDIDIELYNMKMVHFFEDCIDFVSMHYSHNQRDTGKFWKYVQDTFKMSEAQKFYEHETLNNPTTVPVGGDFMFQGENWAMFIFQLLDHDLIEPKILDGLDKETARCIVKDFYTNEVEKHKDSILHTRWIEKCLNKISAGESLGIHYYSGHGA